MLAELLVRVPRHAVGPPLGHSVSVVAKPPTSQSNRREVDHGSWPQSTAGTSSPAATEPTAIAIASYVGHRRGAGMGRGRGARRGCVRCEGPQTKTS